MVAGFLFGLMSSDLLFTKAGTFPVEHFTLVLQLHSIARQQGPLADFSPGGRSGGLSWTGMALIGKRNTLSVVRASAPGLYLDGGELGEILLPGRYIPADLKPKDKLDVFVYRDSEDRLWPRPRLRWPWLESLRLCGSSASIVTSGRS